MPYNRYPDETDLLALMDEMQQEVPALPERVVGAAVEEFERMTGWRPYLAGCEESVQHFDPPDHWRSDPLDLKGGFVEISEVRIRVGYGLNGSVLVEGRDYELLSYSEVPTSWWGIQFKTDPGTSLRSIKVTGQAGRAEELSDDVFEGILAGAAARAILRTQSGPGPITAERMGPRSVNYATAAGLDTVCRLERQFMEAVERHRRMVI